MTTPLSSTFRRSRLIWLTGVLVISLTIFSTWYLLAHQGAVNPWSTFYVVRDRKVLSPVIRWPLVAWVDYTEPNTADKILIKNLETGEIQDMTDELLCGVSANGRDDIALDGDWLVVIHNCYLPEPARLYAYNLVTREAVWVKPPVGIPPEQKWPFEPEISGNRIVWHQEDWNRSTTDVYLFDLDSRTATNLTQTAPPWGALHPDIAQDWVVWDEARFGATMQYQYLVALNLVTSEQITISVPGSFYTIAPAIDGETIVWADYRNSSYQGDIYGYGLDSHSMFTVTTSVNNQIEPAVEDDLVVYWEEVGAYEYAIYGHDLSSGETYLIFQAFPNHLINVPFDIDQQVVVWSVGDLDTLELDIYGAQQLPERRFLPFLGHP